MQTSVPRINTAFGSRCMVYFYPEQRALFLLSTHNIKNKSGCVLLKRKKISYLERHSPIHGGEFPSSQVPCLKSTAFIPLALPSPPHPLPAKKDIYLHTDDITCPLLLSGTILVPIKAYMINLILLVSAL
jgi:hypothetical protein